MISRFLLNTPLRLVPQKKQRISHKFLVNIVFAEKNWYQRFTVNFRVFESKFGKFSGNLWNQFLSFWQERNFNNFPLSCYGKPVFLTLSGPWRGGRIIPPYIKNIITFERLIVLTWNFMACPKIQLALGTWQEGIFLMMSVLFLDAPISTRNKWFYFVHVTGVVFTY